MDLVLIGITAVSLALALAMGLVVFKLLREDRKRSDARVELLAAATAAAPSLPLRDPLGVSPHADSPYGAPGDLFVAPETESPWLRRVGLAALFATVVLVGGYTVTRGDASPAGPAAAAPLELLELLHTLDDDVLVISGTVHNPKTGAPVSGLTAGASLFGPTGALVASGRGGVDYVTLAPGDASAFSISVPVGGTVSRYRVGFRGADGAVVAHVDRRVGQASATNTGTSGGVPWVR